MQTKTGSSLPPPDVRTALLNARAFLSRQKSQTIHGRPSSLAKNAAIERRSVGGVKNFCTRQALFSVVSGWRKRLRHSATTARSHADRRTSAHNDALSVNPSRHAFFIQRVVLGQTVANLVDLSTSPPVIAQHLLDHDNGPTLIIKVAYLLILTIPDKLTVVAIETATGQRRGQENNRRNTVPSFHSFTPCNISPQSMTAQTTGVS